MKLNKKLTAIIIIVLIAILLSIAVFLLINRKNIKSFQFNNYEVSYDAGKYNVSTLNDVENKAYFNKITYKAGSVSFNTSDTKYVISYQFKDKELPPSNALNDFQPILKDSPNSKAFDVRNAGFGFDLILCQIETDQVVCFPVTENYNSDYDYGTELKNGKYYFESKINLLGMNNSKLRIEVKNTNQYPDINSLLDVLLIEKDLQNAK